MADFVAWIFFDAVNVLKLLYALLLCFGYVTITIITVIDNCKMALRVFDGLGLAMSIEYDYYF